MKIIRCLSEILIEPGVLNFYLLNLAVGVVINPAVTMATSTAGL